MGTTVYAAIAALTALGGLLYNPVKLRAEVLGVVRPLRSIQNIHGEGLTVIPNTVQCEDVHHHIPSGLLFSACQGKSAARFLWFPPLANFKDHKAVAKSHGSIYVIDPKTFTSQRLELEGFSGPLVSHGIDLYSPPSTPDSIYIFVVNHLPNPDYYDQATPDKDTPKGRSQIEVFKHQIGSTTAKHQRSIRHPLIRTPNDIYASSPTMFYVTNDHLYREGHLRTIEDIGWQSVAPWDNIIHVTVGSLAPRKNASEAVFAKVAYSGIHNPNGLGHGADDSDILIIRASAGVLVRATMDPTDKSQSGRKLVIRESIQLDCTLDNPSYYSDPHASAPGAPDDASGYVLAGLARACDLAKNTPNPKGIDPVMVWMVQPNKTGVESGEKWSTKLVFQDNGQKLRSASAGVLVGIDPKGNGGRKQAWLFVTGFLSEGMVATKIDL